MKKSNIFVIITLLNVFAFNAKAQLTVDGAYTATQLVQNVLLGQGVTVSNITTTGLATQRGRFNGSISNIGLSDGVILSSGPITNAPGPNDCAGASACETNPTDLGQVFQDPDLNLLTGQVTRDASILEFDFVPASDTLKFRFVFASEEYPEYVGSFNDGFGFFISGPGIAGPYSLGAENIALIPGTPTAITINNVNNGIANGGPCTNCAFYVANGTGITPLANPTVQFDGFTTVITANAVVIPCQTYHIKLAVADAADRVYDSGIFLEANSFGSGTGEIIADFGDNAPKCVGEGVDFMDNSVDATIYTWDFGSGATPATSTAQNPTGIVYSTPGLKLVTLTAANCIDSNTISKIIEIKQTPAPAFTSPATQCEELPVTFIYTGTTGLGWTYNWDFGTGASPANSSAQNPGSVIYTGYGTKTITLTVTNDICSQTTTSTITINQTPFTNFASTAPECTGENVDFTNTGSTGGIWTYSWDFGLGSAPAVSALENPTGIVYSTAGTKLVKLIVTDGVCSDSITQNITINLTPAASFNSDAPQCAGTGVNYTNTGSTGIGFSYFWDFGAGAIPATSTSENPGGIMYSSAGSKTVTLTVIKGGCSASVIQSITINQKPTANFASTAPECTGENVDFTNTGSTGGIWTYSWDFGLGSAPAVSALENPTGIVYSSAGTKLVKLIVTDGVCSDSITQNITINLTPAASFNSDAPQCAGTGVNYTNTGSTGSGFSYFWDFGAGAIPATSTSENPGGIMYSSAGLKTVTLTVIKGGCSASVTQSITINQKPTANFASTAPICTGLGVDFTNTGSTSGSWTYSWDFGLGAAPATSILENPTGIVYSTAGIKSVKLFISDGTCTDSIIKTINIYLTPTVSFTSTAPQCAGTGVNFNNTGITGSNWSYSWDFGQDAIPATSVNENPIGVIYISGGTKNITFTISDQNCNATTTGTIAINLTPVASFTNDPLSSCTGDSVDFQNTGTASAAYSWNFGSGATPLTSSIENPQNVVYSTSGIKTVTLITTLGSCTDTAAHTINIAQTPAPSFTTNAPQCEGSAVNFTYTGTSDTNWVYIWDFGVGSTPSFSSQMNPQGVNYAGSGSKYVLLTVSNGLCSEVASAIFTINQTPVADFTSMSSNCTGDSVDFQNTGTTGAAYTWDFGSGATPATSTTDSPQNIVYSTSGIKTVTLITTLGTCTDTSIQALNINQTPAPAFTHNAPQCEGSAVNFTYTGTSDTNWVYMWDFGVGSTPSSSSQMNPQGLNYTGSGSKYVLLTVSNGLCSEVASATFTINQTPVASFTNNPASTCTGDSIDFLNTGTSPGISQTYTITVQDFQFTPDSINAIIGDTIRWIWVNGTHSATSDSIPSGAMPWNIQMDSTNQSFQYVVTQSGIYYYESTPDSGMTGVINVDAIYTWNFGSGATPLTSTTENPQNVYYSTSGIKTITLITTLGSCTDTAVHTINIAQTPAPSFTTNAPQCEGTDINFIYTGTIDTNWTYIWDFGIGADPAQSSQQNVQGITYTGGGSKTVLLTVSNGLCSEVSQQIININQLPFANAGKDTTICADRSVQIGTDPVSNYTYNWFPSNTLNSTVISNPVSSPIANITNYVVIVQDTLTGCFNKDSVIVTMLPPLNANAGADVEICRNDSIQVGAALVEGQSYIWSPASGLNNINSPNPVATPDSTTTYILLVTGSGCEAVTDEVTVIVHQLPDIDAGLNDSITHGSSTQLIATGGVQYEWTPSNGLSNIGIYNPVAFPDVTTTYTVIGIDIYGCKNDDSVTVYVITPSVWVPSAFTPDGNGKNDVYYVRGEGINNFEFAIFNSWGESVFYSKNISIGWDGRKMTTNEQLPEGAYVYYVKGLLTNGEAVNLSGIVNLIR